MNEQLNALRQIALDSIKDLKADIQKLYEAKFNAETVCIEKALSLSITKKEAQITIHKGYLKLIETLN